MPNELSIHPHGQASISDDQSDISDHVALSYLAGHGRKESENQDAYWPALLKQSRRSVTDYLLAGRLYIVADGISLSTDGRKASHNAVDIVGQQFYKLVEALANNQQMSLDAPNFRELVLGCLQQAILDADEDLLKKAKKIGASGISFQTTCICALLHGDHFYIANVGDSRAYVLRRGSFKQITKDDTENDKLSLALGIGLKAEEIAISERQDFALGEVILLCSDGLYKEVSEDEIETILRRGKSLQDRADDLLECVRGQPGDDKDDVTMLLLDYSPEVVVADLKVEFSKFYFQNKLEAAIDMLERIAWWAPEHPIDEQQKYAILKLAELYAEHSRQAAGSNRSLADRLSESARKLGGRAIIQNNDLVRQYKDLEEYWIRHPNDLSKLQQMLDKFLPIAPKVAVVYNGDKVWSTLLDIVRVVIQRNRDNWQVAGKVYLLVTEMIPAGLKKGRTYRDLQEYYQNSLRREWVDQILKNGPLAAPQVRTDAESEQLIDLIIKKPEQLINLTTAVPILYDGNPETNQEILAGRVVILTFLRFGLLYWALMEFKDGQWKPVKEVMKAYQHWPEANALWTLAEEFLKLQKDPQQRLQTATQTRINEQLDLLTNFPFLTQLRTFNLQEPIARSGRLFKPDLLTDPPPAFSIQQMRSWFSKLHADQGARQRSSYEKWKHYYRAIRWLEIDYLEDRYATDWSVEERKAFDTLKIRCSSEQSRAWHEIKDRYSTELAQTCNQLEQEYTKVALLPLIQWQQAPEPSTTTTDIIDQPAKPALGSNWAEPVSRTDTNTEPMQRKFT